MADLFSINFWLRNFTAVGSMHSSNITLPLQTQHIRQIDPTASGSPGSIVLTHHAEIVLFLQPGRLGDRSVWRMKRANWLRLQSLWRRDFGVVHTCSDMLKNEMDHGA